MLIPGEATDEAGDRGRPVAGRTILLLLNGGARSRFFALPQTDDTGSWVEVLNTARPGTRPVRTPGVNLVAHSLILLASTTDGQPPPTS